MAAVILGQPDRVAFTVFGLDIMWYAICIVVGMVCGSAVACARAPRYGINSDRYLDILLYALPSSIIGARAYYVLFEWGFYREHPDQILNIRAGGLAIHGGLIVAIAVAIFLVHRWKLDPFTVLDLAAPGIALTDVVVSADGAAAEIAGRDVTLGSFTTRPNSRGMRTAILCASFEIDAEDGAAWRAYAEAAGDVSETEKTAAKLLEAVGEMVSGTADFGAVRN